MKDSHKIRACSYDSQWYPHCLASLVLGYLCLNQLGPARLQYSSGMAPTCLCHHFLTKTRAFLLRIVFMGTSATALVPLQSRPVSVGNDGEITSTSHDPSSDKIISAGSSRKFIQGDTDLDMVLSREDHITSAASSQDVCNGTAPSTGRQRN